MLKIRLNRLGRRNLASFGIIITENLGAKIQDQIGYYNPSLKDTDPHRMFLNKEKYEEYISKGAKPSDRVRLIAYKLGYAENPSFKAGPKQSKPKKTS